MCRRAATVVAIFSFAINILMLASPIYMMQVYDRVLGTGHRETLLFLTIMTTLALLLLGGLDALRGSVMSRIGSWLGARLSPDLLADSIRARLMGDSSGAQPLRDLSQVQGFVGGQGLPVFFDAPWVPVFVLLIWFLHPWLGIAALCSAIVLFIVSIANEKTDPRADCGGWPSADRGDPDGGSDHPQRRGGPLHGDA